METGYINWLKSDKKSENTIKNYTRYIEQCLNFIQKKENEITIKDLNDYKNSIANLSSASIALQINAIKSYFNYLETMEIIDKNPARKLTKPVVKNKLKPDMTAEDVRALLNATHSARNRAVISTLASTGMRVEELSTITNKQYAEMKAYNSRELTIVGKGNKERIIYINDIAMGYIEDYIMHKGETSGYLFESYLGNKLDVSNLNKMIKNAARSAGLRYWEDITMHTLRHAFATISNNNGVSVATISAALGHSSLSVTTRYIHNAQTQINNAMNSIVF